MHDGKDIWKWDTEKIPTVKVIEKSWNIDNGFWKPSSAAKTGSSSQSRFTEHEKLVSKPLFYQLSDLDQFLLKFYLRKKKQTSKLLYFIEFNFKQH